MNETFKLFRQAPILFRPEMVRAILAGVKTQTRRVITRRNSYVDGQTVTADFWDELQFNKTAWIDPGPSPAGNEGPYLKVRRPWMKDGRQVDESVHRVYPRLWTGDRLWVKETFCPDWCDHVIYRADDPTGKGARKAGYSAEPKWKSSIHMPKKYSRIRLELLSVRPEQAHNISDSDVRLEGISENEIDWWRRWLDPRDCAGHAFAMYWEKINGKKHPWYTNPWLWVYEFKRVEIADE